MHFDVTWFSAFQGTNEGTVTAESIHCEVMVLLSHLRATTRALNRAPYDTLRTTAQAGPDVARAKLRRQGFGVPTAVSQLETDSKLLFFFGLPIHGHIRCNASKEGNRFTTIQRPTTPTTS